QLFEIGSVRQRLWRHTTSMLWPVVRKQAARWCTCRQKFESTVGLALRANPPAPAAPGRNRITPLPEAGNQPPSHLLLIGSILLAEHLDEQPFFERNRRDQVQRADDREEQTARRHYGSGKDHQDPPEVDRVTDDAEGSFGSEFDGFG